MEPLPPVERVRQLAHTVAVLADELTALRAQQRTILLRPAALSGIDRRLADLLPRQLALLERACANAQARLTGLRTEATDEPADP